MKKKLYMALKIAIVVSALMIVLVALNQEVQTSNQQVEKENQDSQLNVALVNEDNGVEANGKAFYLGSNYIKKIEKDTTHKWFVVSRGVAENGLKNGTYQLLVIIPSNFSEKVLEIDQPNPERVDVNYKVNSNGNPEIENESNKVGSKIVNELNQQLVDMYVASILDNLYTAQVNINRVSSNQNESVDSYKNKVFQPAVDFQTNLPGLVSQSDSALQSNELLTKTLKGHTDTLANFTDSQQQFETTLDKLLSFRAEGKLTYEEFVASLVEMDQQLLNQETTASYEKLKETSQNISTTIGNNQIDVGFSADLDKMKQTLQEEQASVAKQMEELSGKVDSVSDVYLAKLYKYFGIEWQPTDPKGSITLADILINPAHHTLVKDLDQTKEDIEKNGVIAKSRLQNLIKELPYLYAINPTDDQEFYDKLAKVNPQDRSVAETVAQLLNGNPDNLESEKGIRNLLVNRNDLIVEGESQYLNKLNTAIEELNRTSQFDLTQTKQLEEKSSETEVELTPETRSRFQTVDYLEAVRRYSEIIGQIQELYSHVADLLEDYDQSVNNYQSIDKLLELDFKDYFTNILFDSVTSELLVQQEKLTDLNQQGEKIAGDMTQLGDSLGVIQTHTVELQEEVLKQLNMLGDWQKNMSGIISSETKVAAVNSQTDQEVSGNKDTMGNILTMSQALKESSGQNVQESEGVKIIFSNFTQEVNNAQKNGKVLATNANQVMSEFEEELSTNNSFVESFIKVLDNAHRDGVTNDVLLQFIANPVNGRSEQAVKSAEVYKPFTWILIIFVVSFFTGYTFANQELVKKAQNVFKNDRLWISDNILATALVTGSSLLLGLIIGTISQRSLGIPKEQELIWMTVITFLTMTFTLLNHFLIKQFKTLGVGIGLFLLISYVFLTNAIGKTAVLNSFSEHVKNINPLSKSEALLMTFFSNQLLSAGPIIVLIVAIALLVIANLIIWEPKISIGGWGKKNAK